MVRYFSSTAMALLLNASRGLAQTATDSPYTFAFSVDLFQGETGYFNVEGYEGVQPMLTMVRGQTYVFDQTESSNWFHPLGFAYYPDGAHEGVEELEDGVRNDDAPIYVIDGVLSELNTFEPEFFFPEETWLTKNYTVNLTVTDPDVTEIFYFCHIHNAMSGRIYIVEAEGDEPAEAAIELYDPIVASDFDAECGTFDSERYAPNEGTFESELCPDQNFLCGDPADSFDRCMHAIDCKMNYEMRVEKEMDVSNTVAFMHQMIPHHENAVNMARILLKNPGEGVELDEEVAAMLREISNTQNYQITFMRGFLADNGAELEAPACENRDGGDDPDVPGFAIGIMAVLGVLCLSLCAGICLTWRRKASQVGGGSSK